MSVKKFKFVSPGVELSDDTYPMILGLDVSTSYTGWAMVRKSDGLLINNNSLNFTSKKKYPNLYDKAAEIKKELTYIKDCGYTIDAIYIEEALMNFKFGKTSANTLSLLHKFNGIVSNMVYEIFGKAPIHINSGTARKLAKVKKRTIIHSHAGAVGPMKIRAFEHVAATETSFKFLTKKTGTVKDEAYDRADAIIVAKAGAVECRKSETS